MDTLILVKDAVQHNRRVYILARHRTAIAQNPLDIPPVPTHLRTGVSLN